MKSKIIIITIIVCIIVAVLFVVLMKQNKSLKDKQTRGYTVDGDITYLNTALEVRYQGSESCRECHKEIYNALCWQSPSRIFVFVFL